MLLLLPVLTGLVVGKRWPHPDSGFFSNVAQMIATLFIAIAVEFLGRDKSMWQDAFDYWLVLGLVGMSWCGLFACVRAMLDAPHAWMSGVAAAGLMAAAVFVSLALFARLGKATSGLTTFIMLVFLVPPMVLLVLV